MTPYDSLIVPVRTGKEDLWSSELRREARIKRGKESLVEVEYFQLARQRAEGEEQLQAQPGHAAEPQQHTVLFEHILGTLPHYHREQVKKLLAQTAEG
jgi:hypothetical protein